MNYWKNLHMRLFARGMNRVLRKSGDIVLLVPVPKSASTCRSTVKMALWTRQMHEQIWNYFELMLLNPLLLMSVLFRFFKLLFKIRGQFHLMQWSISGMIWNWRSCWLANSLKIWLRIISSRKTVKITNSTVIMFILDNNSYIFTSGAIYECDRDIRGTLEQADKVANCAKCKTLVCDAVEKNGQRVHRCCA